MKNIVELIKSKPDYIGGNGVNNQDIANAEEQLGISFSEEYKAYLHEIGAASFDGRELTGISDEKRFDVVTITEEKRKYNPDIKESLYVVEDLNIEGIVIWQDTDGSVYQTVYDENPIRIHDSLYDYLSEE